MKPVVEADVPADVVHKGNLLFIFALISFRLGRSLLSGVGYQTGGGPERQLLLRLVFVPP